MVHVINRTMEALCKGTERITPGFTDTLLVGPARAQPGARHSLEVRSIVCTCLRQVPLREAQCVVSYQLYHSGIFVQKSRAVQGFLPRKAIPN